MSPLKPERSDITLTKYLICYNTLQTFNDPLEESFRNHCGTKASHSGAYTPERACQ